MEQKFSNNSIDLQVLREFCEREGGADDLLGYFLQVNLEFSILVSTFACKYLEIQWHETMVSLYHHSPALRLSGQYDSSGTA